MSIDAAARLGATLALKLLKGTCTYVRAGEPTRNTSTGTVTPTHTTATLRCLLTGIKLGLVDGTLIRATDQMALIDAAGFEDAFGAGAEPVQEDRIQVGSRDYQVVRLLPVRGGEQYVLHKVVVRR